MSAAGFRSQDRESLQDQVGDDSKRHADRLLYTIARAAGDEHFRRFVQSSSHSADSTLYECRERVLRAAQIVIDLSASSRDIFCSGNQPPGGQSLSY